MKMKKEYIVARLHENDIELNEASKKVVKLSYLSKLLKNNPMDVIFTKGAFDLVHSGHMSLFRYCKKLKDANKSRIFVVGVSSDSAVKKSKGNSRPINSQDERARMIAGIDSVDYVVIFNERYPTNIISTIKPNIYVKGQDTSKVDKKSGNSVRLYNSKDNPEIKLINQYNGKIIIFCDDSKISTSATIQKIMKKNSNNVIFDAFIYTLNAHKNQKRIGGNITYFTHCISTANILMKFYTSKNLIAAGFLHDIVEDKEYTNVTEKILKEKFGSKITNLVMDVTEDGKKPWGKRKKEMLDRIAKSSKDAKRIKCADSIHNISDTIALYKKEGKETWKILNSNKDKKVTYYKKMLIIFKDISNEQIYKEYEDILNELLAVIKKY